MTRKLAWLLPLGLFLVACEKDPPPAQYPQQQYPQQQYPQQQYPQQQYPQQQYPQTQPTTTTPAPQPASSTGTPTAIPGVMKMPDGTCSVTLPSMTGQPSAPMVGPCPPGV